MIRCVPFVAAVLACSSIALAGNAPEGAQRRTEEEYLTKVNVACGTKLSLKYEGDSLRKHNRDIGYDQTGGDQECNEPLRYLWYTCKSEAGRAAVKAAKLSRLVCKGTQGSVGSLSAQGGVITVERAFEEQQPYLRARRQFEAVLRTRVALAQDDPYADQPWHDLGQAPNPVTSTRDYCVVNGTKVELGEDLEDPFIRRRQDAAVKCYQAGALVADLVINKGVKSGFSTSSRDAIVTRTQWREGKRHGEERTTNGGRPVHATVWANDHEVTRTQWHDNGALARHAHHFSDHIDDIALGPDGKVQAVSCSPQAKEDATLRRPCGFEGAVTHTVYDGTGKISRVLTFKDGVLTQEGAGNSDYASGSDVAYKDGKKQGEERVKEKTGKLRSTITWDAGQKHGREVTYAEDGKKVVREAVWQKGELVRSTDRYLNGNPEVVDVFETRDKKKQQRFWDTGKVKREGSFARCEGGRGWCEEGQHRSYYEDGRLESEQLYVRGKRQGAGRAFWPTGARHLQEEYADGRCTKRTEWDRDGRQIVDEEYEADGSRKLKR